MLSEDLYGSPFADLQATRDALETILDCVFKARDSEHYAGLYYLASIGDQEEIRIRQNLDPYDEEPAELDFPQYRIIIDVYGTSRPAYFEDKLEAADTPFKLLRRKPY